MLEHSVVLVVSDTGYAVVKRNFCGFEWEAEVKDNEDHADIVISCNRGVESSSWQCTAVVTVHITVHIPGISKAVSTFHSKHRSTTIGIPRTELGNHIKITIGLQDVSGCRDAAMFVHDFTRSSELTNACIAFENSDTRVYVIREYLLLNSQRFATLMERMVPPREYTLISTSNKSECSDFDVLSSQNTLNNSVLYNEDSEDTRSASPKDDDAKTVSFTTVCQEDGTFLLRGVNAEDFITLLKAIHPPFAEVTNDNVESLLATAFRLGVEHIIWKCETFLRTAEAQRSFDILSRLVFAIKYRMSALENDCLVALRSVNDVRKLLTDSRMESAPHELRILLLETLFKRLTSESCPDSCKATSVCAASQTCFPSSAAPSGSEVASAEDSRCEFEQEEIQEEGKMSINEQEKCVRAIDDMNKEIVNDACTSSPELLPNQVDTQRRSPLKDVLSKRASKQQLADIITISTRLAQLVGNANRLLGDVEGVPRYRPSARELADECKKAAALLQNAQKSHPSVQALEAILSPAQSMMRRLQERANNWDAFVRIRDEAEIELRKLRKSLSEVLAKPRRSASDAKNDFDVISEEMKMNIFNDKFHQLLQLAELLDPLESAYSDVRFINCNAQQIEMEYDDVLDEMSSEIENENLLCRAVDNFNTWMNATCNLLSREPTKENIENIEKFQLPTLRALPAMLKEIYHEANQARKHVDPDSYRFAVLENHMKTLDSMLEDAKKAVERNEQERIIAVITAQLSQFETLPFLEFLKLPEDSLNEMENQLHKLPKDQADELQRLVEVLRNSKKRLLDFCELFQRCN